MTNETAERAELQMPIELTESERSTLTHALHIAAERFELHARELATATPKPAYEGLAAQFTKQANESRALAERIDNAEFVRLGKPVEDGPVDPRDEEEAAFDRAVDRAPHSRNPV